MCATLQHLRSMFCYSVICNIPWSVCLLSLMQQDSLDYTSKQMTQTLSLLCTKTTMMSANIAKTERQRESYVGPSSWVSRSSEQSRWRKCTVSYQKNKITSLKSFYSWLNVKFKYNEHKTTSPCSSMVWCHKVVRYSYCLISPVTVYAWRQKVCFNR